MVGHDTLPGMPQELLTEAEVRTELESLSSEKLQVLAGNIISDVEQGVTPTSQFGDELDLIIDVLVKRASQTEETVDESGELPLGIPAMPAQKEQFTETKILFQGSAVPDKETLARQAWWRREREHLLVQHVIGELAPTAQ